MGYKRSLKIATKRAESFEKEEVVNITKYW